MKKKQVKSKRNIIITTIAIFFVLLFTTFVVTNKDARDFVIGSFAKTTQNQSNKNDSDYLIGLYYMPKPAYVSHQFQELQAYNREPEVVSEKRITKPLLGYYSGNDQAVMDQQIKWASDYGIDFFYFDDYWEVGHPQPTYGDSVNAFLKSKYTSQLKFVPMITRIYFPDDLTNREATVRSFFVSTMAKYYKENYLNKPNILKINGKPVVSIFTPIDTYIWNNTSKIKRYLYDFERAAGQDIYWIWSGNRVFETTEMASYSAMGFEAISPYYIAPGITFNETDGAKQYSEFTREALAKNKEALENASKSGIKFIPSATSNYDIRLRHFKDPSPYVLNRSYTVNGTLNQYKNFLVDIKSFLVGKKSSPALAKNSENKILLTLGAYNEWSEGAHLEPGYSSFSQSDPFALLKAVSSVFEPSKLKTASMDLSISNKYTLEIPTKSSWVMGSDDARYWYIPPNAHLVASPDRRAGTIHVVTGKSVAIEGAMNIDTSKYKGVRVPFVTTCSGNNPCLQSIGADWFTTSCTDDNIESCADKTTPNKKGKVFIAINKCVKTKDSSWAYCDLLIPKNDPGWVNKLELLRLTFYFSDSNKSKTLIGLGEIRLLPR